VVAKETKTTYIHVSLTHECPLLACNVHIGQINGVILRAANNMLAKNNNFKRKVPNLGLNTWQYVSETHKKSSFGGNLKCSNTKREVAQEGLRNVTQHQRKQSGSDIISCKPRQYKAIREVKETLTTIAAQFSYNRCTNWIQQRQQ